MKILFRTAVFACVLFALTSGNVNPAQGQVEVALTGFSGIAGDIIEVAVDLTNVETSIGYSSFSFTVVLDTPDVVFLGHEKAGTLSASTGWAVNSSSITNKVGGFSSISNAIGVSGPLIILRFRLDSVAGGVTVLLDKFTLRLSSTLVTHFPDKPTASIASLNGRPSATPTAAQTEEDNSVVILLTGFDPESDPLTFSIFRTANNGSVDLVGSAATYRPADDFFGTDSFEFITNDAQLDSSPATVTITVLPVNDPPGPFGLTSPDDGATITVAGSPADIVAFSWEFSVDPDADDLTYQWQLSESVTFTELLLSVNAGTSTEIGLSVDELAGLLSSKGITVGEFLSAHHRAVVTDGIVSVVGTSRAITFERGLITDTEESEAIPRRLLIDSIFPNPAAGNVTVRYALPASRPVILKLFDVLGREVLNRASPSAQPGYHEVQLDVAHLPAGVYQVRLEQDGLSQTRSLVVHH